MKYLTLLCLALASLAGRSAAAPLSPGAPAPEVSALDHEGQTVELGAVYSKQPYTLVYFYPKADTPGCTAQGCSLRDAYAELTDRGVAVLGVSTDSVAEQKKFKEKHGLPFRLLADTDKKVMQAFGQDPKRPVASRQAYLIHDGRIVYADHKGTTSKQAAEILAFLAQR